LIDYQFYKIFLSLVAKTRKIDKKKRRRREEVITSYKPDKIYFIYKTLK
jgi:hypothetical protein